MNSLNTIYTVDYSLPALCCVAYSKNDNCKYTPCHQINNFIFSSMMFGIGTKDARLHANVFINLLGECKCMQRLTIQNVTLSKM